MKQTRIPRMRLEEGSNPSPSRLHLTLKQLNTGEMNFELWMGLDRL